MSLIKHISWSQFQCYLTCPKRYEFRYIKGIVIPPPGSIVLGKAFENVENINFRQKIYTQRDISLEQALDLYVDSWKEVKDEFGNEIDWEGKFYGGQAEDEKICHNDGIGLIKIYHTKVAPKIKPLAVQEEVNFEFEGIKILGYLDIEDISDIIDLKVSTKGTWTQEKVNHDQQLVFYSLVFKNKKYRYDIIERPKKDVKNRTYRFNSFYKQITQREKEILLEDIYDVVYNIEVGRFPRRKNPINCNYCGYKIYCW
ncbi:MAG TPA: hypothetical protein ENG63_05015 [Candidatus Desulfofervidus auxilii]|uniref:PD-(D/E)XK endonuclease-like domain-containing protein n=1 Tax=Desulfofervidus auxilii TaxID=1621989 RepID=A0A7C0U2E8_DESA2|nr:hypothetical protein [Candidatus Desulfofervidus auxilii]